MSAAAIVFRLPRNALVAVVALVALLQPAMTPLAPDLAGWLPNHGHIYVGGIPVPHHHPGAPPSAHADEVVGNATAHGATDAAGVVFTFEDLGLFASLMPPSLPGSPAPPEGVAAAPLAEPTRPASLHPTPSPQPPQA